jgi:hypothetical protein
MRKLKTGMHRFTDVHAADEKTHGGASHEYYILRSEDSDIVPVAKFAQIIFQKGPVNEEGVNGCFMEDLLSIVVDRLEGFQSGDFSCRENALALIKVQEALHWLNHRTKDRIERDVEGKFVK